MTSLIFIREGENKKRRESAKKYTYMHNLYKNNKRSKQHEYHNIMKTNITQVKPQKGTKEEWKKR